MTAAARIYQPSRSRQHLVRDGAPARYHGGERVQAPDTLVVHCTGGDDVSGTIGWLNRPNVPKGKRSSYTAIIGKDGAIWRHCPLHLIAYHAGDSAWPLLTTGPRQGASLNGRSLGIALANDNGSDGDWSDDPITPEQSASLDWLLRAWLERYRIRIDRVRGHYEVSPGRKFDPLPRILDMEELRRSLASPSLY